VTDDPDGTLIEFRAMTHALLLEGNKNEELKIDFMIPEVNLDRFIRAHLSKQKGCDGYLGKLDLATLDPVLADLLHRVQGRMNNTLGLAGSQTLGGAQLPPIHFDYIHVSDLTPNAHVFQHEGFSFIVLTLPMVALVLNLSIRLGQSQRVVSLLNISAGGTEGNSLSSLLFEMLLNFFVSHEYAHLFLQHGGTQNLGAANVWTEFVENSGGENLYAQAQELDADAFAATVVLNYFLQRRAALPFLFQGNDQDEILMTSFLLGTMASFCAFWFKNQTASISVWKATHPPPHVRLTNLVRTCAAWCDENGSVPIGLFSAEKLLGLFDAAVEYIPLAARPSWDLLMTYLETPDGSEYQRQLFDHFTEIRQKRAQTLS
jgi:hypothetical protein